MGIDIALQETWQRCLHDVRSNMSKQDFDTWFSSLQIVSFEEGTLTLAAPNKFVIDFIEGHFLDVLKNSLISHFALANLKYVIQTKKNSQTSDAVQTATDKDAKKAPMQSTLDPQLRPDFTFENFVKGQSNKLALSVATSIAKDPAKASFNPFFLYGPSGVGKTHLVNAIGVRLKEVTPNLRVLFVPANLFKTQYTDSVRHNTQNDFLHFYQTIDVLIIDDIQEISTEKTQQVFFHIFNHLQHIGKQIIMTCDKAPARFEGIEDRMLTRFKSGIVVELERPDVALRQAILRAKLKADGLKFSKEVVDYIACHVESNVRELRGVVNSLMAYSIENDSEIDIELVKKVVARAVNLEKREMTPEIILRLVCKHFNKKMKDVMGSSRKRELAAPRQLAMYLCHKYTGLSFAQIGRVIGKRDHTTVMHACNVMKTRIVTESDFRREVEEIEAHFAT